MASTSECTPAAVRAPDFAREYGLDALRVFAFSVLILYHAGMGYVTWEWHVKNPVKLPELEYAMLFANRWRLPLLFFISGAGVAFSLRRRSWGQFAGERMVRLLAPLLFGIFVIVPPQIYIEWLHRGRTTAAYWEFYPEVFRFVAYPQGATSWHHLWFVAYVLVYALLSIPLFAALRSRAGERALSALAGWMERWGPAIYLVNVPNLAVGIALGPHWPTTHNLVADWANLTGSWLTFLWGFVFASNARLLDLVTRRRREFLVLGLTVAAVFFTLRATGLNQEWSATTRLVTGNLISGYFGFAWIFALVGYARAWVTRPSPVLRYTTEAVYPFYIVHQTVTVALVYWMIPWQVSAWLKFTLAATGTFVLSWAAFAAVSRVTLLRPLFGLKLKSR